MNWTELESEEQLEKLIEASFKHPQLIFKNSTRCFISRMALSRVKKMEGEAWMVTIQKNRAISNLVAETFHVWHESPQVLIIKDGKSVYDESHGSITAERITGKLDKLEVK